MRLLPAMTCLTLSFGIACASPSARPREPLPERRILIDTMAIRGHTFFLAHELLMGRGTGTKGADLAAAYVAAQCRALGLEPVGPEYFQEVPLERAALRPGETVLTVTTGGRERRFENPRDFVVNAGTATTLADFSGPAVFVGSGAEILRGAVPELRGAVAVTLGTIEPAGADTLRARGAVGMLHLTDDADRFALYAASRNDLLYLSDHGVRSSYFSSLPSVLASPGVAEALLTDRRTQPGALEVTISVHLAIDRNPVAARNVACLLRGTDVARRDTAIALTAHYDHLGVSTPDERGDSVYNGFSDNAAGVAMLLSIADAFKRDVSPPRHSVLFLFFTGEERGLLGSDYYVARPLWPLQRTTGVINLDAGAPPARPWSWRIAGGDGSPLGTLAMDVALAHGWSATTSSARANSDYFPFFREGVPAIFIVPSPAPYQGLSADSSNALRRRWDRYHQAGDEWFPDFPFAGLGRYAEYAYFIASAMDGRTPGQVRGPAR